MFIENGGRGMVKKKLSKNNVENKLRTYDLI